MKYLGIVMAFFLGVTLHAGHESGGGVPPAPKFMPEDASYQCEVKLTQLNPELNRPFVSRTNFTASWKKGDYAGFKGGTLKDLKNWKYFKTVPYGPFHMLAEEEVPTPANGATLEGLIYLGAPQGGPGFAKVLEEQGVLEELGKDGFLMELRITTTSVDGNNQKAMNSETNIYKTLESRKTLFGSAKLKIEGFSGEIQDYSNLNVICKRIE